MTGPLQIILLIFSIGKILFGISPEIYQAWLDILATVKATSPAGNDTSVQAVKASMRAILPILPESQAAEVAQALDSYETGAAEYAAQLATAN
jgi:hypothetical protein